MKKDEQSLSHRYQNEDGLILYKQGTDMYNTYAKLLATLLLVNNSHQTKEEVLEMRKYEVMYILKADLDDAARKDAMDKLAAIITDNGGKVENTDESMGLRDLAYPIKDQTKGYYVVLKADMDNVAINEFNRLVRINPVVLRHLIVVDHK